MALNPASRIVKIALRIGLILATSFVLIEGLMIVLDPYVFKGRFEYDRDLGFKVRAYYPNGFGMYGESDDGTLTNRFGFNAPDYPLTKAPGTFRIVVVGDSFGWAGGLKGNYTHLLQQLFDQRGDRRIEIINTGYPGTHTGEELAMLKKYALQYDPDLVVLGFFAGNDFFEADPNRKRIVLNDCLLDIDRRHERQLAGYPLVFTSRLWLFLSQKYELYERAREADREAQEWAEANGQAAPRRTDPERIFYQMQHAKLEFFNRQTSATQFGPNIDFIFRSISEMNELLKARHVKFMVAIFPDVLQVSAAQFDVLVNRFGLRRDDYDLDLAQTRIRSYLDSQEISYLDLLARFRIEEQQRELYRFRNAHWNQAGNQLAAELLIDYLKNSPAGQKLMSH
ncbi:MAG TPA: SGNH/GDSL hydrolase family protein [Pyrinomonadaceae bacterium]|nr:SGNH/GDSL hydrolase family protein [Pyrinomonadaceae bacterium]